MAKTCFVISVIGDEDTDVRRHADLLKDHIIEPAIMSLGYDKPARADQIADPGIITNQIVTAIRDADLVIADLSIENGNVFYELAIGHAAQKPVIHMALEGSRLPFDNQQARTIFFGKEIDKAKQAIEDLQRAIKASEKSKTHTNNPIGQAIQIETVAGSKDVRAQTLAQILTSQSQTQHTLNSIFDLLELMTERRTRPPALSGLAAFGGTGDTGLLGLLPDTGPPGPESSVGKAFERAAKQQLKPDSKEKKGG